jgi:hypothetical protein
VKIIPMRFIMGISMTISATFVQFVYGNELDKQMGWLFGIILGSIGLLLIGLSFENKKSK